MTGSFEGLDPARFALAGSAAAPPRPANDNEPGIKGARGYRGLLLRRGGKGYEILLCHVEPGLSKRVETADDDTDIIALWRSIGRKLNLTLFAETDDGQIVQIEPMPALTALPRRYGSAVASRRPRFLARRRPGLVLVASRESGDIQNAL
ncbi:MAG: DUF6101 family protein [Proteobacteria bacterium]|nr:DUF6101 family protein [Pseudomonadota bacterium]